MISVVSPVYNEAGNIVELCDRVTNALEGIGEDFEFILVENGSSDHSLEIIKNLREKDSRIKFVSLSRNFGHQVGILSGLRHASGDAVISLDGDLQHPPELIPRMVKLWKEGFDIVFTTKKASRNNRDWKVFPSRCFYKLISFISELEFSYGQSDYRLLDRKVADILRQIPEKNMFLRGMVEWTGFCQTGVEYEVEPRKSGESKFSFKNYINFALDGILSFSTIPLKIFLWFGIIVAVFASLYGFYYLGMGVINILYPEKNMLPPGSATITVGIFFLGGIQLIGIGCLGEYIGRIYSQTKGRPDFIVREKELE